MARKHLIKYALWAVAIVLCGWLILTLYVEREGRDVAITVGNGKRKAMVIFDPDPFYNLDEQVCVAFARGLSENDMKVIVVSVAGAKHIQPASFDLYVYCANTYNWQPDWAITGFIDDHKNETLNKPVVAITLGAGSTQTSQKSFEKRITANGAKLVGSYALWLWRPNNEERMEQPNVEVAAAMAYTWGKQVADKINPN